MTAWSHSTATPRRPDGDPSPHVWRARRTTRHSPFLSLPDLPDLCWCSPLVSIPPRSLETAGAPVMTHPSLAMRSPGMQPCLPPSLPPPRPPLTSQIASDRLRSPTPLHVAGKKHAHRAPKSRPAPSRVMHESKKHTTTAPTLPSTAVDPQSHIYAQRRRTRSTPNPRHHASEVPHRTDHMHSPYL